MLYSKISFKKVQDEVERILNCKPGLKKWDLMPDSIDQLAKRNGIELKWRPILNWDKWLAGKYDYSEKDFIEIAFAKVNPSAEKIYIITDDCFKDRMAFSVNYPDIFNFIKHIYPAEFEINFMQPLDFIFVQPDQNILTMIHHEGVRTKYVLP